MTDHYDLAIIGNGAIGLFAALEIANSCPSAKLALIAPPSRKYSATMAAGAMCAIYAELEAHCLDRKADNNIFSLAKIAHHEWSSLFTTNPGIKTANDTIVYLKNEHSNFEYENFEFVKNIGEKDGVVRGLSKTESSDLLSLGNKEFFDSFIIENEFGFSVPALIEHLETEIQKTDIQIVPDICHTLNYDGNLYSLLTSSTGPVFADKTLICAGAASSSLDGNVPKPIQVVSGVGTALQIFDHAKASALKSVIRTVNRGGAQCGFHLVPQNNSFYMGAGNYISFDQTTMHRIETIRYLTNCLEEDLFASKDVYSLSGQPVVGTRARAIDGLPVFGAFDKLDTLFVASGFNRVGLTLAPCLAKFIAEWFHGNQTTERPVDWNAEDWRPDRELYNYNSEGDSVADFVNTRLANAFEHRIVRDEASRRVKEIEFEEFATYANVELGRHFNTKTEFGFHPDMLAPMLNYFSR
jgi:glycine/D-amino acid oxidase-like deaminating enzyme